MANLAQRLNVEGLDAPRQQQINTDSTVRIVALTRQDLNTARLHQISELNNFDVNKPCCCCCDLNTDDDKEVHQMLKSNLSKGPDSKLAGFGVAVDADGRVLGYIMLGFHDTPGDATMPEWMQDSPHVGVCHLEQVCLSERALGMEGVEKKLMVWAEYRAREQGCTSIDLEIIGRNTPAKKAYEEAGYVVVNTRCQRCKFCAILCCLVGSPSMYAMRKHLSSVELRDVES